MGEMKCVSSFVDIGRGEWGTNYSRSNDKYLDNFIAFYSIISLDVIIFCNESIKIELERRISEVVEFQSNVSFEDLTLDDLPAFSDVERIRTIQQTSQEMVNYKKRDPSNPPEYSNPEYVAMMFAKPQILKLANDRGLIDTEVVAWVDFGIGHGDENYLNCIRDKVLIEPSSKDKIVLFNRQPSISLSTDPHFYSSLGDNVLVCGGFHIIPTKLIDFYCENFGKIVEDDFLSKNIADDDQTIMSIFAAKNMDKCEVMDSGKYKGNPNAGDFFPVFEFLKYKI
jgi:hypothetical protein